MPITVPSIQLDQSEPTLVHSVDELGLEAYAYSRKSPDKESANEDTGAIVELDDGVAIMMVADGCGGMRGGHLASRLAIEVLTQHIQRSHAAGTELRHAILDGVEAANEEIRLMRIGAACTIAILELNQGIARPYHVGDSMILVTNSRGRVRYQSVSHSPVGYAVASGMLSDHEAMQHEHRHVVSNVIGCSKMRVEVGAPLKLSVQDRVLVASDGLFDNVYFDEVVSMMKSPRLRDNVDSLFQLACDRMQDQSGLYPSKPDDLTIIAARIR